MQNHVVVSVEGSDSLAPARRWQEAVSTYVGKTPTSLLDQELIECEPIGGQSLSGRIESGDLGGTPLSRLMTSPNRFRRSLKHGTAAEASPLMLVTQQRGSAHFEQGGRSGTLDPGDWCVLDTRLPFEWTSATSSEQIIMTPRRPSDEALRDLINRGIATRCDGKTGIGRVVQTMLNEAFCQLDRLEVHGASCLADAISSLTWNALHEQLDAPPRAHHGDTLLVRIKTYIEERLADSELSVDTIAHGCGISVRSVHRAFVEDPLGPVSNYIWHRRVAQCAVALKDEQEARRSITDIALSWGFTSSSHFSRMFRSNFGTSPRLYRAAA